eukprot:3975661-Pyramimonas_sp.AAC.1
MVARAAEGQGSALFTHASPPLRLLRRMRPAAIEEQQLCKHQSEGAERSFTVPGCVAEVGFRVAD